MPRPARAWLAWAVFFALCAMPTCTNVRAQSVSSETRADEGLVHDALRLAFHESPTPQLDAAGIHAVLVNGARERGVSTHAFARAHSPHFFAGTSDRPWFVALGLDCERPAGFHGRWDEERITRSGVPLASLRSLCVETVALLRALDAPACPSTTWGAPADYVLGRFAREHAHDVFDDCGPGARNRFSHAPGGH